MRITITSIRNLVIKVSSDTSPHKEWEENFLANVHGFFLASQDYDIFEFLRMLHKLGLNKEVVPRILFYAKGRAIFGSFVAGESIEILLR